MTLTATEQRYKAFRATLGKLTVPDLLTPLERAYREQMTKRHKVDRKRTGKWGRKQT